MGASLSGENLFDVLIGTEERCFDKSLILDRLACLIPGDQGFQLAKSSPSFHMFTIHIHGLIFFF